MFAALIHAWRRCGAATRAAATSITALALLIQPAAAAWTPPGVDLTRPRILLRAGDEPLIRSRLDRQPYRALLDELLLRIRQADGVALDDHAIAGERNKARAAKNLAFLYAIDRTVIDGEVAPFPSPAARAVVAARAHDLLLHMYTRCRLAVAPPLGGFDRDINTSEELQQYATAYDTMRGAGYDFGADDAAIVDNLIALASELYENYVDPATAGNAATVHQNNHRSKTGAALAVAAMALAEYTPAPGSDPRGVREPANWFAYGLDQSDLVMRYVLLTGDGAYGEGPFYLRYAAQNLLPFWRAWDRLGGGVPYRVGGADIPSFWRHPLLARTLHWALDTTLPDGSQAPTDDGNVGRAFYFGAAPLVGDAAPGFAWRWAHAPPPYDTDGSISLAADAIANFDDSVPLVEPSGSPSAFYVDGGTAVFRSDWSPDAVLAIVQAEHDTASEFGRDRDGRGVGPQSHEHAEPGAFLLHAFGERLALDPGYFSFGERSLVSLPEHHNIILVDGAGPTDYLLGSFVWRSDLLGRPPVDGHAMLSATLDGEGMDAAHVTTRYGQPADRAALIERRFLFADDRYLFIADRVSGPSDPAPTYTWLVHGNGGGDSGGTFEPTATGGRWRRPNATLEAAFASDAGAPLFATAEGIHESEDRARKTHTVLRATAAGAGLRAVELLYPMPAGAVTPIVTDLALPGVAGLVVVDAAGDRQVLALQSASGPLTVPETMTMANLAAASTDGAVALFDANAIGALRLAWAEGATRLSYGELSLSSRTAGRLGLRLPAAGVADLVVETADPMIGIGDLDFVPGAADGACALLHTNDGAAIVLGRERRVELRAAAGNSRPAADPGPDRDATPPQVVTLEGRGSCDADGDTLTPHWDLVAAPPGSAWSLEEADTWTPRLFADRSGPYRVRLVVTDTAGAASRPREVLVRAGSRCENGLDDDLDGWFDSDDADCDASSGQPIDDRLGHVVGQLRVGESARYDVADMISSSVAHALTFQAASTDSSVAAIALEGGRLEIHAIRQGAARVIVTADDGHGERAFDAIDITVAGAQGCAGDCDADGIVAVEELITGVAIALGRAPFERCPALDGNIDGEVRIEDLIGAMRHLLASCP